MSKKESLRLEYLDGLRALASLYVVLFHAGLGFIGLDATLPGFARLTQRMLAYGHDAVAVFIVLSGYCLMLPVARAEGEMKRGIASYVRRRAWRILPPYYATLLLSLLLLLAVPQLQSSTQTIWDDTNPAFEPGSLLSHLFVVHNLFPELTHRINGPLWSVATEWQIYFVFPFLLLPIWRRFGALATCAVGFVLGGGLVYLSPGPAHSACTWYVGLFAMGMCGAGIGFASRDSERALRERIPWGVLTLALLGLVGIGATVLIEQWFVWMPLSDALVGAATASALVYLTRQATVGAGSFALRVLESAPLVFLGKFSYSLYLTHLPLIALGYLGLRASGLALGSQWLALTASSLPVSIVVAYAFYWAFERRFVGTPPVFLGRRAA